MNSLVGFLLLLVVTLSHADQQVVGTAKCGDCKENNFKTSDAFSGLHVTIDCKLKTGQVKRMGVGEVDEGGSFKVSLPQEMIQDGKTLKEECFAQLHCPAQHGLEAHKIEFKPQSNTFGPKGDIQFSTALCTSKFLWPFFKYPPLSKDHWKKTWPKISFPPLKQWPPLYKIYKPKPLPPHVPIYKPKPPVVKPPAPIYKPKPKPPVYKPNPPVYKPKPPVYKPKPLPPPVPVLKKPLPPPLPLYPIPPFYKKPCPPFPKIPNYFKHPKLGYFPPLPPSFPQP